MFVSQDMIHPPYFKYVLPKYPGMHIQIQPYWIYHYSVLEPEGKWRTILWVLSPSLWPVIFFFCIFMSFLHEDTTFLHYTNFFPFIGCLVNLSYLYNGSINP